MDDFDFKPITKGLGFDKKAEEKKVILQPQMSASFADEEPIAAPKADIFDKSLDWNTNPPKASRAITEMINALPPSIDFDDKNLRGADTLPYERKPKKTESKVYKPIGRAEYSAQAMPEIQVPTAPSTTPTLPEFPTTAVKEDSVDVSLNNTLEKAFPKAGFRRPFFHQTVEVKPQYSPVTASFTSGLLDLLVITGLTSLFLVSLILVTKIDLIAVVTRTQAPLSVWLELGAIFCGVYLLYYMCTRGLWGSTLGDWAFDMQLGLEEDRMTWYYPAQVVVRMIVIAATGFVTLPLLSFLFKRDLAETFSGLRLYTKNY